MTGQTERVIYSWDTNVVLALLKNEKDKPISTIADLASDIQNGKARLTISTLMLSEILDVIENRTLQEVLDAFFRLPSVQVVDVNRRVARQAAELRWECKTWENNVVVTRKLKVPDAIILATAQLSEAEQLHTFDQDLLKLHGTDVARGITICKPCFFDGRQSLFDDSTEKPLDTLPE